MATLTIKGFVNKYKKAEDKTQFLVDTLDKHLKKFSSKDIIDIANHAFAKSCLSIGEDRILYNANTAMLDIYKVVTYVAIISGAEYNDDDIFVDYDLIRSSGLYHALYMLQFNQDKVDGSYLLINHYDDIVDDIRYDYETNNTSTAKVLSNIVDVLSGALGQMQLPDVNDPELIKAAVSQIVAESKVK